MVWRCSCQPASHTCCSRCPGARPRLVRQPSTRNIRKRRGNVFIGKAVKAVAPHPRLREVSRQGECLSDAAAGSRWNAVSKQATCGSSGRNSTSARIAAMLCGWCSGASGTSASSRRLAPWHRCAPARVTHAAVNDAMPGCDEIGIPHVRLQPIEEELQGAGMLRRGILLPRVFADGRTARIFRVKASPAIKLLQVATDASLSRAS